MTKYIIKEEEFAKARKFLMSSAKRKQDGCCKEALFVNMSMAFKVLEDLVRDAEEVE